MKPAPGDYCLSSWQPLYCGIEYASGAAVNAFGISPPLMRVQHVNILKIDLSVPGIEFHTTPKGGLYQTTAQLVTDFLSQNPQFRVAINGCLSWSDGHNNFSLFGLAISQGQIVCDPSQPAPQPCPTGQDDVPDPTYVGAKALLITKDNKARFETATAQHMPSLAGVWTAIAGSPQPKNGGWPPQFPVPGPLMLVENGATEAKPQKDPVEKVAARSAIGLSSDGSLLYLLTIDGAEHVAPQHGAGFYDAAQWLMLAGVHNAINLDGGASTIMARSDPNEGTGHPKITIINVPYGDDQTPGIQNKISYIFSVKAHSL